MKASTIGGEIRRLRTLRGLTQLELANAAGTTQPSIVAIEMGHRNIHQSATLFRLADALGVMVDDLRPLIESYEKSDADDVSLRGRRPNA